MKMPSAVSMRVMDDGLVHFVADITRIDHLHDTFTWLLRCGGRRVLEYTPAERDAVTCLVCAERGPV